VKFFLFFVVLFPCLSMANKSFVCPENNFVYKGVTCCLDAVSQDECINLVNQKLPKHVVAAVASVQQNYQDKAYAYGRVPNCFWQVGVFANLIEFDSYNKPMEFYDLMDLLSMQEDFQIQEGQPIDFGDVLMFSALGEIREDVVENNIPKRKWFPFSSIEHGAIALDDGLLFQKENIGSSVFSIDSIGHTLRTYESGWKKNPQLRGTLQIEIWRQRRI